MYMFNSKKNMCTKFDVMVIFCYLGEKTHLRGFPNVLRSFCNFQLSRDPCVIFGPMGFLCNFQLSEGILCKFQLFLTQ